MKVFRESIQLQSGELRPAFHTITAMVKEKVACSGVKNGICVVYSHHTTCSVMIQEESFDVTYKGFEFLHQDLMDIMEKIIPTCRVEGQYLHPGPKATDFAKTVGEDKPYTLNTDGHLRSALLGRSETVVIADGELDLGQFGHIYFVDLDTTRSREREVQVQIIGE